MNQDELEKIKATAWDKARKYLSGNDIYIFNLSQDSFSQGFDAGVEALQKELDEAVELINEAYPEMLLLKYKAVQEKAEPYKYIEWQDRVNKFLAKVKRG
jgi:hypothetical protein